MGKLHVLTPPLYTFSVISLFTGLALLLNQSAVQFDVGWFLLSVTPSMWATLGVGITIGLSVIGAAWGIFLTASSILSAGVREPRIRTRNLISIVFSEAVAIYGIAVSMVMVNVYSSFDLSKASEDVVRMNYYGGYAFLGSGVLVGFANLLSGVCVGIIGSSIAISDAQNASAFLKLIIMEIFATALGIFGVISGILMISRAKFGNVL